MKNLIIFGIVLIQFSIKSFGQISTPHGILLFSDTITFRPLSDWIHINNPEINIWEVGQPNKDSFTSAYSGKEVIITDSINFYPNNLNDYFTLRIPCYDNYWGEGILSFYHKYQTDSLRDGGVVEVSYDNGLNWVNIMDDINHINTNFIGLYKDTITGGKYGYSGNSGHWEYVEFYWWWIALTKNDYDNLLVKFSFISDSVNSHKAGWMIDDIVFRGYSITGSVEKSNTGQPELFPNPTDGLISFEFPESIERKYYIEVYDLNGTLVKKEYMINRNIDIRDLKSGLYLLKIFDSKTQVHSRKILKN